MNGKRYYITTITAWQRHTPRCAETHFIVLDSASISSAEDSVTQVSACVHLGEPHILALVIADEAAHIALENDPDVEPLPHPLARAPISDRAAAALAPFGIIVGDDTFVMAEKLARVHPLLKHRVF